MSTGLGIHLKIWRSERGWSLRQLAARSNVSAATLSHWEANKHQPFVPELEAVLTALEVSGEKRKQAFSLLEAPRALKAIEKEEAPCSHLGAIPRGGDLLRALRIRKEYTLRQASSFCGVNEATLSRWERSEMWPGEEKLHALCFALDASEEELLALTVGGFSLSAVTDPLPDDIEGLIEYQSNVYSYRPKDHLMLALIGKALPRAKHDLHWREFLMQTCSAYAFQLSNVNRFKEAWDYAQWALDLRESAQLETYSEGRAALISARAAVYKGKRLHPKQGREIVLFWQPYLQDATFQAWALSYLAEYEAMDGSMDDALRLSEQSVSLAARRHPVEGWMRQTEQARLLTQVGRASEAMTLLSNAMPHSFYKDPVLYYKLAWAFTDAGLALGETQFASSWLNRFESVVERYQFEHLRDEVDALRHRL